MKKKIIFNFLLLIGGIISCSKNDYTEEKFPKKEITKENIFNALVSKGVKPQNITFTDTLSKENALYFASMEELEKFLEEEFKSSGDTIFTDIESVEAEREGLIFQEYYYQPDPKPYHLSSIAGSHRGLVFNIHGYHYPPEKIPSTYHYGFYLDEPYFTLSSYLTGFTFMRSYSPIEHRAYFEKNKDAIDGRGSGLLKVNFGTDDIGTIYTRQLDYRFRLHNISNRYVYNKGTLAYVLN